MVAHPFSARQMGCVNGARTYRVSFRIEMKNDPGGFGPYRPIGLSIKQPQIDDKQPIIIVGRIFRHGRRCKKLGFETGPRSHEVPFVMFSFAGIRNPHHNFAPLMMEETTREE